MCKSLSSRNSFTKDSKNGKYGLQEQYVLYKLFFNLGRTYYRRIKQRQIQDDMYSKISSTISEILFRFLS